MCVCVEGGWGREVMRSVNVCSTGSRDAVSKCVSRESDAVSKCVCV